MAKTVNRKNENIISQKLNAAVPAEHQVKIEKAAANAVQAAHQNRTEVEQNIHRVFGITEETNLHTKEAVILGHDLVAEKGVFAIASEIIHEWGAGAVIQTNSAEAPITQIVLANQHAGDHIVVAGSYQQAMSELRARGYTSFHFILSEADGSASELRKSGQVQVLTDFEIGGLLAKFESILQEVRAELRLAEAA